MQVKVGPATGWDCGAAIPQLGDVAKAYTNSLCTLSLPPIATQMEACSISPRSCLGYSASNFQRHNLVMSTDARLSFIDSGEQRKIESNGIPCKVACQTVHRVPRRFLLESMAFSAALLYGGPAPAAPLPEMKEPEIIRSLKLRSGVKIQDIVEGEGAEAHEGDLVEVNYVCRRSNGYFVHSTVDQFTGESRPVILLLDDKEIIQGLKEVLVGMKVGGKRRALIPPNIGYVNENLKPIPDEFGPRRSLLSHAKEPLVFEVQLLNVL